MTEGLVSVIVPCYNGTKFVDRCFKCLMGQSYKRLEIIAVDDGSTDHSLSLMESYAADFEKEGMRLKCVRKENGGEPSAINFGLKYVTGEFLHLLDIDDLIMPDAIEAKLKLMEDGVDLVVSNGYYINMDENDEIVSETLFTEKDLSDRTHTFYHGLLMSTMYNWAGAYILRCKTLFDFYPDREIYVPPFGQNLQLLLPCSYKKKVVYTHRPLMKYFRHKQSSTYLRRDKALRDMEIYAGTRQHLINVLIEDSEKADLQREFDIKFGRQFLAAYAEAGLKKKAKASYKLLKKHSADTKSDRNVYLSCVFPRLWKLLKGKK